MARIYRARQLKFDIVAGIVVFLIAVPLCLGVALASGAPLFSGIVSGIIGGILVGFLSSSHVSVSGPSPGIAAVVLAAIAQLGDFHVFLLALALAGILQFILGSLRAGFIVEYVPSNVVQGLLCAIGFLLIIKQLPLAFTVASDLKELQTHLLETTEGFTISPFYSIIHHINTGAAVISCISLAVLIYFEKTRYKMLKEIPASIIVVILGILLNEVFIFTNSSLAQNYTHLVNIPSHENMRDFLSQFQFPDWNAWSNPKIYLYAVLLCIVTSLESLMNIKAGEKLDIKRRSASKDRELLAQGAGNLTAGLLGGIPVTSVIVRTTVNIQSGARTKLASIFHGFFLLITVLLLPDVLNKIPISSLAIILIYTGYKLTKPAIFKNIYRQGMDRFIPFLATVASIVIFNLLAGIIIGLAISLFYILKSNSQARLDIIHEVYPTGATNRLVLPQQISFLNKASLVAEFDSIPNNSQLIIDARYSHYIDKEIIELIKEFKEEQAPERKIALNLIGFKKSYNIHNYIDFINVTTYNVQATLTPLEVLNLLREGNQRFLHDTRIHRSPKIDIKYTAQAQHPMAIVLACIDSRVPVETIFDMSFGDLFCVRVAGNVINNDVLASIEYACHVAGAKLIVVLGHTRCGAIQAACDNVKSGHISQLLKKIQPAIEAEKTTTDERNSSNSTFVDHVTSLNAANTIHQIYEKSSLLKPMIENNEIGIIGGIYNVERGRVHFDDYVDELKQLNYTHEDDVLAANMKNLLKQAGLHSINKHHSTAKDHKNQDG